MDIVNNLLDSKHDGAWKKTKPPGVEGNNLLIVVEKFAATVAGILEEQIARGDLEDFDKPRAEVREHIGMGSLVFFQIVHHKQVEKNHFVKMYNNISKTRDMDVW